MKELLEQYAGHNLWAHQQLQQVILQLTEEQQQQKIASSFPSIHTTILHQLDAESIWWQRMKLKEHIDRPSEQFAGNTADLYKKLLEQSKQWEEWVRTANEQQLLHAFSFRRGKHEVFTHPVYQVLIHLFNHQSYHRGQLVTMLRQLGQTKIPSTDFIAFVRNRK